MQQKKLFTVSNLVLTAMLSAVAFVLMILDFPVFFLAPSFYKLDFSEVPALIGSFSMGPVAGAVIEALKIVLKLLYKPSSTAYIGEIGNFIMGCAMVVPAGIMYKINHTRKGAVAGLLTGTVVMCAASALVNGFMLLPWYVQHFFKGSVETLVGYAKDVPLFGHMVTDLFTFSLLIVVPFNLFKGIVVSIITFLLYKPLSRFINKTLRKNEQKQPAGE